MEGGAGGARQRRKEGVLQLLLPRPGVLRQSGLGFSWGDERCHTGRRERLAGQGEIRIL